MNMENAYRLMYTAVLVVLSALTLLCLARAVIGPRIADDCPRRVQEQSGDAEGDDEVRPGAAQPRHETGGNDNRRIADGVVARE